MAKLYAPAGLRSLGIEDDTYAVGEDGLIEVAERHIGEALAHGCRREAAAETLPEPDGEVQDLAQRVAALEAGIAGLTGRLSALEAQRRPRARAGAED